MKSLYVHIPFCNAICHYCDFPKRVASSELQSEYIEYLLKEIKMYKIRDVETVYIGGGTPTSLSFDNITKLFSVLPEANEVTIEANPNDISNELLELLKSLGVTRISLGIQTFNEDLLVKIGRTHSNLDSQNAITSIKKYGFDLSVDMIFNLPGQTLENLQEDVNRVKGIDHISYYSLILEPNTVFEKWINKGKIKEPDNGDLFFETVIEELTENGYDQYEISNFALTHKSAHNLTYWNNEEYIGVGLAASGYLNGKRYKNHHLFKDYFKLLDEDQFPKESVISLSKEDMMFEHLMLGFRKLEGIDIPHFVERFGIDVFKAFSELEKLVCEDYLVVENDKIRVTKKGLFYNNDLLVRLM